MAAKDFSFKTFQPKTKVAVIVAARNEEGNISDCLNDILKQNYPKELFEIIAVDDFSSDKTFEQLQNISDERLDSAQPSLKTLLMKK